MNTWTLTGTPPETGALAANDTYALRLLGIGGLLGLGLGWVIGRATA